MSYIDDKITKLRTDFSKVVELCSENQTLFTVLQDKVSKLNNIYSTYSNENTDQMFIFALDCFHYQARVIHLEYEDMQRLFLSIKNRIYCEYYKLHQVIVKYITEEIDNKKVIEVINNNNSFPEYRDLEPYKEYSVDIICQLHDAILLFCTTMKNELEKRNEKLQAHKLKNDIGMNLSTFVSTYEFKNTVLNKQIDLFLDHVEIFHRVHFKYLNRFTTKMNLFISQVNHDIKIELNSNSKDRRKSLMDSLDEDSIDESVIKDLTQSIASPVGAVSPVSRATDSCEGEEEEEQHNDGENLAISLINVFPEQQHNGGDGDSKDESLVETAQDVTGNQVILAAKESGDNRENTSLKNANLLSKSSVLMFGGLGLVCLIYLSSY
tara:strand:+ start:4759 stop:5898 length:1140 start_codon:yes stop_codon:yes gene_type:complete